jgi:hypothetical protein
MQTDKMDKNNSKKSLKVLFIILSLIVPAYFIMVWISPESKYLGKFLIGFTVSFAGIVLVAYCINYIAEIYRQIQNKS